MKPAQPIAAAAQAPDIKPHSHAALAEARKADKPAGLNLRVLAANDGAERDLKEQFAVRSHATLVVLRGTLQGKHLAPLALGLGLGLGMLRSLAPMGLLLGGMGVAIRTGRGMWLEAQVLGRLRGGWVNRMVGL